MPGPQGYQVLDFGNYLSLIILDSGHTHPIPGAQTQWLYQTLKEREHIPHKFALYHVPAYPARRNYKGKISPVIRQQWVPIFEQFGLTAAFEHHDHVYKRSQLIRKGKVDSEGVLYLGDGGWGIRKCKSPKSPKKTWYLAKTAAAQHVIVVTIEPDHRHYAAIDRNGNFIDQYDQNVESENKVKNKS